ncbi:MAG: pitrilysin family protein [Acholeplasmataceae bacterium]
MIILRNDFKTIQIALYLTDLDDHMNTAMRYLLPRLMVATSTSYPTRKQMNEKMEHLYGAYFSTRTERMGNLSVISIVLTIVDPKIVKDSKLIDEAISLFEEVLSPNRPLNSDVFMDEKRMLIEEWETLKDRKRAYARYRFSKLFFEHDSYGYPMSGTLSDIKKLTLNKLQNYYQKAFQKQVKHVIINGNLEEPTVQLIQKKLGSSEKFHLPYKASFEGSKSLRVEHELTDMKQAIIHMGYHFPIYRKDKLYDAALLSETIIGGYPESRLFKVIREEKGLCYDIGSAYDYHKGVLTVTSGVDLNQLDFAITSIRELIDQVIEKGITEQELRDAKSYYIHQLKSSLDHQSVLTKRAFIRDIFDIKETIEEKIHAIESVREEDVWQALKMLSLVTIYVLKGETK